MGVQRRSGRLGEEKTLLTVGIRTPSCADRNQVTILKVINSRRLKWAGL